MTLKLVQGALAQLGEHLLCKQGVIGSIPIGSTSFKQRSLAQALARMPVTPEMKIRDPARIYPGRGRRGLPRCTLTL